MATDFERNLETLSNDIQILAKDLRYDNLLHFASTADTMHRYLDIVLVKYAIKQTYYNILHSLITRGGVMTPTELSKRVYRSKHAITRAVDTMEREGLVVREGIGIDRRTRKVAITRKGLEAVKKSTLARQTISHDTMSCFNEQQSEDFNAALRQLRKHLLDLLDAENSGSSKKVPRKKITAK
jgi:DNA-binding MarR family transcriptional regulator